MDQAWAASVSERLLCGPGAQNANGQHKTVSSMDYEEDSKDKVWVRVVNIARTRKHVGPSV